MKKSIMHQITEVIRTILHVWRRHRRPRDLNMIPTIQAHEKILAGSGCNILQGYFNF